VKRLWIVALLVSCAAPKALRWQDEAYYGTPAFAPATYEHYVRGRKAALEGHHEEAARAFARAVALAPDEPFLQVAHAEELLFSGQPALALAKADAARARFADYAPAWVLYGRVLLHRGTPLPAQAALERALELDPDHEPTYPLLADSYRQEKSREAVRTWQRLVIRKPESVLAHYQLGRALLLSGELEASEPHLVRAVELDGDHIDAQVALAELYRKTNRRPLAAQALELAFERSAGHAAVGQRLFRVLLESGDRAGALDLLGTLAAHDRPAKEAIPIGALYLELRQPDEAVLLAKKLVDRDRTDHAARLLLCQALDARRQLADAARACLDIPHGTAPYAEARVLAAEALADDSRAAEGLGVVSEALSHMPGHAPLLVAKASMLEAMGDLENARSVLGAAQTRLPMDEDLLYARAQLEDRAGHPDRGIALLEPLLATDPDDVTALNFIGFSYADRGVNLADANRLLSRAAELRPDDGFVLDSLGWLRVQEGRLADAASLLERANRLSPEEPEILFHLGELAIRQNDPQAARALFLRALALEPKEDRVRRRLQERLRTLEARAQP
jgi:tetratricopeptide (TPR) repeat protein